MRASPAITAAIGAGISVNVTLIFSLDRYREVIDAYLAGLEQAKAAGIDLSTIHSVASFFVSRVDTEIDKRLDAIGTDEALAPQEQGRRRERPARLRGATSEVFAGERATALLEAGANRQRPLWASTGVKDPRSPTPCTSPSSSPHGVVNTMPEKTLEATFDHGEIRGDTVTGAYDDARRGARRARARSASTTTTSPRCSSTRASRSSSCPGTSCSTPSAPRWRRHDERPHRGRATRRGRRRGPPHRPGPRGRPRREPASPRRTPTLWGPDAEDEASKRLGWTEAVAVVPPARRRDRGAARASSRPTASRPHRARRHGRFVARARGHQRAPPASTLTVLDSTDPGQVRAALADRLDRIGRRHLVEVRLDRRDRQPAPRLRAGVPRRGHRPRRRASSSSPTPARRSTRRRAPPATASSTPTPTSAAATRRSPRSASCPRGLAGVDIAELLDEAETSQLLADDDEANPGLVLGAAIAGDRPAARQARDRRPTAPHIVGFADWAEQLIAESTGKEGTGILPVVLDVDAPELAGRPARPAGRPPRRRRGTTRSSSHRRRPARSGSPGTPRRAAARLGVRDGRRRAPARHQPVRPARRRVGEDRRARPARRAPRARAGRPSSPTASRCAARPTSIGAASDLVSGDRRAARASCPGERLRRRAGLRRPRRPPRARAHPRPARARGPGRPVTFGWGPRFLHSTGQFHKGGPAVGVFLQITEAPSEDLEIPDRPFTFGAAHRRAGGRRRERARRARPSRADPHADRPAPRTSRRCSTRSADPEEDPHGSGRDLGAAQSAALAQGLPPQPHRRPVRPHHLRRHRRPRPARS